MAGNASDFLELALLRHIFGLAGYSPPVGIYVGLYTAQPPEAGAGPELSGGGYVRMASGAWSVAAVGAPAEATNTATVEWPPATADWPMVSHGGLWDAVTGGNLLYWFLLTDNDFVTPLPKTVAKGDVLRMALGQIKVRLD